MMSCFLLIGASFGVTAAALTGYPLYLGVLAGWLYLSVVFMAALLPGMVMDHLEVAHRRRCGRDADTMAASVKRLAIGRYGS